MTSTEERLATLEAGLEDLCKAFELHERRQEGEFKTIAVDIKTIEQAMLDIQKQLSNRLPVWATLLITGMGTIIGILVGAIANRGL